MALNTAKIPFGGAETLNPKPPDSKPETLNRSSQHLVRKALAVGICTPGEDVALLQPRYCGLGVWELGFRGLGLRGLGFRGLGFSGLGWSGLGLRGLGLRGLGGLELRVQGLMTARLITQKVQVPMIRSLVEGHLDI